MRLNTSWTRIWVLSLIATASATTSFASSDPHYLSKHEIVVEQVLSDPPAPGSKQDIADFTQLLELQQSRTSADCERAVYSVKFDLETSFGPQYGALSADEVETWNEFFHQVKKDAGYFAQKGKKLWQRPRPYLADSRIQPCVELESSYAYPSGHATVARVFARVLAQLAPERAKQFMVRGDQIGSDRVLSGVHHPSDIEAGRKLGDLIFEALMRHKSFVRDLEAQQLAHKVTSLTHY